MNKSLSSHIITDLNLRQCSELVLELLPKVHKYNAVGRYNLIAQEDYLRSALETSTDDLRRTLRHTIEILGAVIQLRIPISQERLVEIVESLCGSCYHCSSPASRQFDNKFLCLRCLENVVTCHECGTEIYADKHYMNAETGESAWFCNKCHPKTFQCTDCSNHFVGGPVFPNGEVGEYLTTSRRRCCRACAGRYMKVDCGHISRRSVRVTGDGMEDDNRDRDHMPDDKHVCERCASIPFVGGWNAESPTLDDEEYRQVGSPRTYGVELEICAAPDKETIPEEILYHWTCKGDASLPRGGVEMVSPVCSGDDGLRSIRQVCQFARACGWTVDARGSCHLHIGTNGAPSEQVGTYVMGYMMTYPVWLALVARSRGRNRYCRSLPWTWDQFLPTPERPLAGTRVLQSLLEYRHEHARRVWCNVHAWKKFKTIEIRLHQGTLDPDKIINWIKAHTRFADWCMGQKITDMIEQLRPHTPSTKAMFEFMADNIWKDAQLKEYFFERSKVLHQPSPLEAPPERHKANSTISSSSIYGEWRATAT